MSKKGHDPRQLTFAGFFGGLPVLPSRQMDSALCIAHLAWPPSPIAGDGVIVRVYLDGTVELPRTAEHVRLRKSLDEAVADAIF